MTTIQKAKSAPAPKGWVLLGLLLLLALPAGAVAGHEVKYVGGTTPGLQSGAIGRLDTTSDTALIFEHAGSKLAIPYSAIQSFDYSTEVTHHLGVLPLILVSLFRMREHRHFFRISYGGPDDVTQVAVFEVPKQMPRSLRAVLEARSSHFGQVQSRPCTRKSGNCSACRALP
jgi:hypothetical protein